MCFIHDLCNQGELEFGGQIDINNRDVLALHYTVQSYSTRPILELEFAKFITA